MAAKQIISTVHAEFGKHSWDTFVENPPAVAGGGRGVVVPDCPTCKVRLNSTNQLIEHLRDRVLEACRRELQPRITEYRN